MTIALNLTIKRKWFDMILAGEKREEYRDCKNPQCCRLCDEVVRNECGFLDNIVAVFRNGYRMDSRALVSEITGLSIRSGSESKHPEWGEPTTIHFVLGIGNIIASGPYGEVKKKLEMRNISK